MDATRELPRSGLQEDQLIINSLVFMHAVGRWKCFGLRGRKLRERERDGGGELRRAHGRKPHVHSVRHPAIRKRQLDDLRLLRLGCWLSNTLNPNKYRLQKFSTYSLIFIRAIDPSGAVRRHHSSDGERGGRFGVHELAQRLGARLLQRAVPRRGRLHLQRHLLQRTYVRHALTAASLKCSAATVETY